MQLPLFKALKSINIEDQKATEIVDSVEDYIAVKMKEVTAPIAARIDGVDAKLSALDTKMGALQWTIGIIGAVIAIATAFSGVARFIAH